MSIPELLIREIRAGPVVAPLPRPVGQLQVTWRAPPLLLVDVWTESGGRPLTAVRQRRRIARDNLRGCHSGHTA